MKHAASVTGAWLILLSSVAAGADFYVAPNGNDAWSGTRPEPNAARTDGPFATLHRARDAVRTIVKSGLREPVNVFIRGGTYRLDKPLVLGPEDSGAATCPITYAAYQGERVVLSAGRQITGWKTDDGKVWYADIPAARAGRWKFRQIFVDGRREIRARYPNFDPTDVLHKGWLYAVEPGGFGVILAGVANAGDWVEYEFYVRERATYTLWVGYATIHKNMQRHLRIRIDGRPAPLGPMPPSGHWRKIAWARGAPVRLAPGRHVLRCESRSKPERRIHFDAFVLTDRASVAPKGETFPPPAAGEHRIVIQAESDAQRISGHASIPQGFIEFECKHARKRCRFRIHCRPGVVRKTWAAPGAEVNIFAAWGWFNEIVRIKAVDPEQSLITIEGRECLYPIRPGNRFFVANVRSELDAPGEWYLDSDAGRLYYWPRERPPTESVVIAPALDRLVHLRGDVRKGTHVRRVRFRGLTFAHTDYTPDHKAVRTAPDAALWLECASQCTVERCTFVNIGGYAIRLHLDSCDNVIADNTMTEMGAGGVLLTSARVSYGILDTPGEAAAKVAPIRNTITRNHIHHGGRIHKYVSGVHIDTRPKTMAQSPGNVVSHNHIHHMPRLGIFTFGYQGGNVLEHNHIHHVMLESDDGGGIHLNPIASLHTAPTLIRHNLIHDVLGPRLGADGRVKRMFGFGVYLDGSQSNCVVAHNLIYRTSYGSVFIHGGDHNVVENNILMGDVRRGVWVSNYRKAMAGNRIRRNIICVAGPEAKVLAFHKFNPRALVECDYNLFWRGGQPIEIENIGDLAAWRAKGYDAHSVVADPLFGNPAHDEYTLRPNSPALKLGFKPFLAGIKKPRPGRIRNR